MYGKELIIDLYDCDIGKFNRKDLKEYFYAICEEIDMIPCKLTFWDDKWTWLWKLILFWDRTIQYETKPHTKGTTAVQFILTSNITIHTLEILGECYVNIFSCKEFDSDKALKFTRKWFNAEIESTTVVIRGRDS